MNGPDGPGDDDMEDLLPPWADEGREDHSTPYTEAELDGLVDGAVAGMSDTAAWLRLVAEYGQDEARQRLRAALILRDENAASAPRQ
jgi:uncharacterized protein YgfB (UPF0149 family)